MAASDAGEPSTPTRSAAAQLLVIGARGLDPLERVLFGSVGVGLIKHAECPAAVIPAAAATMTPSSHLPVLVGVDGSRCSTRAVAIAFDEATSRNVGLVAVTTWSARNGATTPPNTAQQRAEAVLDEALASFTDKYPDVCVDRSSSKAARRSGCRRRPGTRNWSVLGSRGRGGITGATLGSVSQAVLQASRIPVLIAPCRQ
ncbi:universal stress protein [Nocardia sputi]|uniref:universal stress protein n=1 Tax=Nocardia sputi TaxID=2943705 RepID=UPI003557FEB9